MSPRVAQVAKFLALKMTNAQIAERMGLSEWTVKSYVSQAYAAGAPRRIAARKEPK